MKFIVRVIVAVVIMAVLSFAGKAANAKETTITQEDAYILTTNLLNMDQPTDIEAKGKRLKAWYSLLEKARSGKAMTKDQVKLYLFMNFITNERVKVHTHEEIGKEIVSIFDKNAAIILSVWKELPFLVASTCATINESKYLMPDGVKEVAAFKKKYRKRIVKALGSKDADKCLQLIVD